MNSLLPYTVYFAAFLISAGLYVVLSRKNLVFILIGVELMLNGGNLFLAYFSANDPTMKGQIIGIFSIVLTVCEVAIALVILLNIYKKQRISNLDELNTVGNE